MNLLDGQLRIANWKAIKMTKHNSTVIRANQKVYERLQELQLMYTRQLGFKPSMSDVLSAALHERESWKKAVREAGLDVFPSTK